MSARPLYELTAAFNAIFDLAMDESMDMDELESGLRSVEGELEEKCAGGIALIKSLEAYTEAYAKEQKRFEMERQALENRIRRIKEWYRTNLDAMGKTKVPTKYGVMSVQNNGGRAPLRIDDESLIPEDYLITMPERKVVDNDALYKALKNGTEVPGAHLEPRGRSLRIK